MISIFATPTFEKVVELPTPVGDSHESRERILNTLSLQLLDLIRNTFSRVEESFQMFNTVYTEEQAVYVHNSIHWLTTFNRLVNEARECATSVFVGTSLGDFESRETSIETTLSTQVSHALRNSITRLVFGFLAWFLQNSLHRDKQVIDFEIRMACGTEGRAAYDLLNSSQDLSSWTRLVNKLANC